MSTLNDIEKIIHRITICSTAQAEQVLCDFLKIMQFDSEKYDKIKNEIVSTKYPHWQNYYRIINNISSMYDLYDSEYVLEYFNKIKTAIQARVKYEEAISHILPLEQREYANLFSHFNEYRFQSEIKRLVKRIANGERIIDDNRNIIVQPDEDKIVNSEILHNTVRWLYRIAEKRCFDDGEEVYCDYMNYLQALDAAMEINIKHNSHGPYDNFCGFRMCDVCWRFVAYSEGQLCRCDKHVPGINTRDYQKATAIYNLVSKREYLKPIYYLAYGFIDKMRPVLFDDNRTELFYDTRISNVGSKEAFLILDSIEPTLNRYRLPYLMPILSRTRRYIERQGGNPYDWESVIETLDPSPANEPEPYKSQRKILHSALCRDPTPFRLNLAFCEAWLRLHNVKYSLAGRGGARPNTGGRRVGAGRPRKNVKE